MNFAQLAANIYLPWKYKFRSIVRSFSREYPRQYFKLNKAKRVIFDDKNHQNRLVNRTTLLTVEGFPRSGNSYMCKLIKEGNSSIRYKIANHMHHPMNIIISIENDINSVCMIRKPKDAIIANVAHFLSVNKNHLSSGKLLKQKPVPSFSDVLEHYLWFYNSLFNYRSKILFVPLTDLIENEENVLKRINSFHNLDLSYVKVDKEKAKSHMLPNHDRNKIKYELEEHFSTSSLPNLEEANLIYDQLSKPLSL